jgi:hypothetical protein
MKRDIVSQVIGIIIAIIAFSIIWYIASIPVSGFSGALGGIIGGVLGGILGPMYLKKYQDERFTQLTKLSMRNMSVFLILALPWSVVLMLFMSLTIIQAAISVLILWFVGLCIHYLSLFYYYKH